MNRREHLRTLLLGTAGTSLAIAGCEPVSPSVEAEIVAEANTFYGRTPEEAERDERLQEDTFFTPHELETITVLANTILPPGETGDIVDAQVPEFIEFIAKDVPAHQIELRGGLAMLDQQAKQRFNKEYKELTGEEQATLLDPIASPDPTTPHTERTAGENFFGLIRGLVCTGFYTSAVGVEELGYQGNQANLWDGVPDEVLAKYAHLGIGYDPEWIARCINHDTREVVAEWDEQGNLLT